MSSGGKSYRAHALESLENQVQGENKFKRKNKIKSTISTSEVLDIKSNEELDILIVQKFK